MATFRPNILYIMTDQQSANAMSCAGNPDLHTPAMDSLASEGMRFSRATCAFPLCMPARSAMFTGRWPHQLGIFGNSCPDPTPAVERPWLGRLFAEAGYTVAYGGKTHLAPLPRKEDYGWEIIAPWNDRGLAESAIDFLERPPRQPFFLTVSYDDPHNICEWARGQRLPYGDILPVSTEECPGLPPNFERSSPEPETIRANVRANQPVHPLEDASPEHWRHYRYAYFRLVERVDRQIGRILKRLEETGLARNTIVVFTSDHGDGQGAHRLNQKEFFYEEQMGVPFLVRHPDHPGGGRVCDALINSSLDLFPTLCEWAGIEPPSGLSGHSLVSLVNGKVEDFSREAVFAETGLEKPRFLGHFGRMVRTDRFKYILFDAGQLREQFFDLKNDPGEMTNLWDHADHQPEIERHRNLLREWCQQTNDNFPVK